MLWPKRMRNWMPKGKFLDELVTCREKGETILAEPVHVQYMDVGNPQIVSALHPPLRNMT